MTGNRTEDLQLKVYTVMADDGIGGFLWNKDDEDRALVGGSYFDLMDRADNQDLISKQLFNEFVQWSKAYMKAQPRDRTQVTLLDWNAHNAEGKRLAANLKQELGSKALRVQYKKDGDDPTRGDRFMLN